MVIMISITVILEIDPARLEEFLTAITTNAAASRKEPGCLRFEVAQQLDGAPVFALAELYSDQAAVDAHYASAHFAEWKKVVDTGIILKRTSVRGNVLE